MSKQDEEARIAAAVQKQVTKIVAEQQKQFSKMMEKAMKDSLRGVDKANAALMKERKAVMKELDAAKKERDIAEREGEKMAEEYFEGRRIQFREAAQTELLRDLVRTHLEAGKSPRDIANWFHIPMKFIEDIRQLLARLEKYNAQKPKRTQLDGNPKIRYTGYGRGGTIYYESLDAHFEMWWEFGGGKALVIVDIPTPEHWEERTKLPLDQRENVLTFIGGQVLEDKNMGVGSFIIGDNVLTFYA